MGTIDNIKGGGPLILAKLDELVDSVDKSTHLLMNKTMRRRLEAGSRLYTVGGYINYELNEFGKMIAFYRETPILIADKDNFYNDILPFNEDGNCTSIYCLSLLDYGLNLVQNGPMKIIEQGLNKIDIYWNVMLCSFRSRTVGRLKNITDAIVTG